MAHQWSLRCPPPAGLVHPLPVDPTGEFGPKPSAARGKRWRRTSQGFYVPSKTDPSVLEQRLLEVDVRVPPGGALTGWAALRLHGGNHFDGLGRGMQVLPVPVVMPANLNMDSSPDIDKLRAPVGAHELMEVQGIVVTEPNRALFDLMARSLDWRESAVHASVACSAGVVNLEEFKEYVARRRCIAGIVKIRRALLAVDDRVRSPREADLMQLWLEAGLPKPLMNWPIHDEFGTYLGAPDLLCPQLGVYGEYDGLDHGENEVRDIDADRDTAFRLVGLVGFRLGKRVVRDSAKAIDRIMKTVAAAQRSQLPKTFVLADNPEPVVARELRRMAREFLGY